MGVAWDHPKPSRYPSRSWDRTTHPRGKLVDAMPSPREIQDLPTSYFQGGARLDDDLDGGLLSIVQELARTGFQSFGTTTPQLRLLTSDQINVGDFAISSDNGILRCYATSATGSSWEAPVTDRVYARGGSIAITLRYLDLSGGDAENSVLTQVLNQYNPGHAFRVERARMSAQGALGVTILGVHKNGDTTPEETQSATVGANEWWSVDFSTEYAAGDVLAFSIDPTTGATNVAGYLEVRRIFPE